MKIIFIEKTIENEKLVKTAFFTLNLEEEVSLEIFDFKFFLKKMQENRKNLSKRLNKLLREENYSLTENLKKYAIFESLLHDYIENMEEEFILKNENKKFNYKSVLVNDSKFLLSIDPEKLSELIIRSINEKKSFIIEIISNLDSKETKVIVKEMKEDKKEEKEKKK